MKPFFNSPSGNSPLGSQQDVSTCSDKLIEFYWELQRPQKNQRHRGYTGFFGYCTGRS